MRIVIVLHGIQYEDQTDLLNNECIDITRAIIKNRKKNDIFLLMNGMNYNYSITIFNLLKEELPKDHIRLWYAPQFSSSQSKKQSKRCSSLILSSCIKNINPDWVLFSDIHTQDILPIISTSDLPSHIRTAIILNSSLIDKEIKNIHTNIFLHGKPDLLLNTSLFSESILQVLHELEVRNIHFKRNRDGTINFKNVANTCFNIFNKYPFHIPNSIKKKNTQNKTDLYNSIKELCLHKEHESGAILCAEESLRSSMYHQLYIDVSELYKSDARTGIQRVTRTITKELLFTPISNYLVRPVYGRPDKGCYYYADALFQTDNQRIFDTERPVFTQKGDIFIGLDLTLYVNLLDLYITRIRKHGCKVYFVVYDILPLTHPQYCAAGMDQHFLNWINTILKTDGAICISQATAEELRQWIKDKNYPDNPNYTINWFHLGSDVQNSLPTKGLPKESELILSLLKERPSVLMVATLEPRKGHSQTLAAFELLWNQGVDVNLVFVGKEGWNMSELASVLNEHPERGKRLFWLQGISDEYLEKVYDAASVALMASEGEGFGLPIVEAARHKKNLLLRDLPVFREVAEDNAFYFSGLQPECLASAIRQWLQLNAEGKAPSSSGMKLLTWKESAQALLRCLHL